MCSRNCAILPQLLDHDLEVIYIMGTHEHLEWSECADLVWISSSIIVSKGSSMYKGVEFAILLCRLAWGWEGNSIAGRIYSFQPTW